MNRVIKFRGKNIRTGHWHYGFLIGIIDPTKEEDVYREWGIHSGVNIAPISWVIPSTVGQFTGLLDKDGKEIYEGDVVKYYQPYSNTWHTHIVKWDKRWSCFGLFQNDSEWCKENDWVKIIEIEVIGNIHDNPELINY